MIRFKIFDSYGAEIEAERFIKEHNISREQIISINMAIDSEAHRRISKHDIHQILLVYEDKL